MTDVFGHKFLNSQLLADQFAELGDYYVVVPDLFNGDPVDEAALFKVPEKERYLAYQDWKCNHTTEHVEKILEPLITAFQKKYGKPQFTATVGYCFGAKYSVRLQGISKFLEPNNIQIDSAAIFHPSFVDNAEFKGIKPKSTLLLAASDDDDVYTYDFKIKTEQALRELAADKTVQLKYKTITVQGVGHGYAVRGDITKSWVKHAKENAFRDALDWFKTTEEIYRQEV